MTGKWNRLLYQCWRVILFDNKEVKKRLKFFHFIYYTHVLRAIPGTFKSWLKRRKNVQVVFKKGTMPEDKID